MGFYRQFDQFDPKTDSVPRHPFSMLPDIVRRARYILRNRSADEILTAAQLADWMIEMHFEQEKEYFIQDQLRDHGWACQYLTPGDMNEEGLRKLISDGLPDTAGPDHYFDFDTPDTLSEIDALRASIGEHTFDDPGLPNPRPAEFFAAVALWLVSDCLSWLNRKHELLELKERGLRQALRTITSDDKIHMSLAGQSAIKAMDAVSYAEHLVASERLQQKTTELKTELRQREQGLEEQVAARVAKHRSAVATAAAHESHKEDRESKEQAIRFYEENRGRFKSYEAAAREIAKQIPFTTRTIAGWLSTHEKTQSAGKP